MAFIHKKASFSLSNPSILGTVHGGSSWEFLVWVCCSVLQILILFQTKKCHFPHPFSDPTSEIHTRILPWPLGRNCVIIT